MPGSRFFIKAILFSALLIMSPGIYAQEEREKNAWPDHLKLQHAGGIGYFSIGAGYILGKGKLEADLVYGFVPESIGGLDIHSVSTRISWLPIKPIGTNFRFEPLATGVLVNYTFGKQYFGFAPENYPFSYYNYPTSLHAAIFVGSRLSKPLKKGWFSRIGLYYELVSFDTELASYAWNTTSLSFTEIWSLGIGGYLKLK
jgi:hypothetical protein